MRSKLHAYDVTIASLKDDCNKLKEENNSIKQRAIDSEIMYKRDSLILEGLNVSYAAIAKSSTDKGQPSSADVVNEVVNVCNNLLGGSITSEDISSANVMSAKLGNNNKALKAPAVIVRFTRRVQRDKVFTARLKLSDFNKNNAKKVYISKDLTAEMRQLLGSLRALAKSKTIQSARSRYCQNICKEAEW